MAGSGKKEQLACSGYVMKMDAATRREVKALLMRGENALIHKEYERASGYFRKAYSLDPDNVNAVVNLGYAYVKMGRLSHAQKCFASALEIDPQNPVALKNLNLLMKPGNRSGYQPRHKPKAEEEIYIKYMQWGNLQFESDNYYSAVQYFQAASAIHPDFIEPYLKIGQSFENLREYSRAFSAYEEALSIYPNDPVAKEHLKRCEGIIEGWDTEKKKEKRVKESPPEISIPPPSEELIVSKNQIEPEKINIDSEAASRGTEGRAEKDVIDAILNQYSNLLSDTKEKPKDQEDEKIEDVKKIEVIPKEKDSSQLPSGTSQKIQPGPAGMDDAISNILMQFADEIPQETSSKEPLNKESDEEEKPLSSDKEIESVHTGAAPLSGRDELPQKDGIRVELTENQKDALRELGNIGASHAATTLSTMLGTPIMLNVPEIAIVDFNQINNTIAQENSAMVIFSMEGQMAKAGFVILHVPQESVVQMTSIMLGMPVDAGRELNEMDESAINEIGNIMVSAFLDGTAELLGIIMLPSPPRTIFDLPKNVFNQIIGESNILYDNVVFFKTELICDEHELNLNIFMLPNPPVLSSIVRMLEKIIEDSAPE